MCWALSIFRSGYYDWKRKSAEREGEKREKRVLVETARRIHEASRRNNGNLRILQVLRDDGKKCGKHRLERLMKEEGIRGRKKRKWVGTTDLNHGDPVLPNRLNREFETIEPNRKWFLDITYWAMEEDWLYIAAINNGPLLQERRGGVSVERIDTELVLKVLDWVLEKKKMALGVILHSDRVCEYISRENQKKLWTKVVIGSMSRKGNCRDKAPMESFFGTLKT